MLYNSRALLGPSVAGNQLSAKGMISFTPAASAWLMMESRAAKATSLYWPALQSVRPAVCEALGTMTRKGSAAEQDMRERSWCCQEAVLGEHCHGEEADDGDAVLLGSLEELLDSSWATSIPNP